MTCYLEIIYEHILKKGENIKNLKKNSLNSFLETEKNTQMEKRYLFSLLLQKQKTTHSLCVVFTDLH